MHDFLTVAIPFHEKRADAVDAALDRLGNPAEPSVRDAFRGQGIHFMSISVLRGGLEHDTYLILEGSCDYDLSQVLAECFDRQLRELLGVADVALPSSADLTTMLRRHAVPVGQSLFATPGLTFTGTPSMSVERIRQEHDLSRRVRELVEARALKDSPLRFLQTVRAEIQGIEELAPLLRSAPTPILDPAPTDGVPAVKLGWRGLATFGWPWFVATLVLALTLGIVAGQLSTPLAGVVTGLVIGIAGLAIFALVLGLLYTQLRRLEASDVPDDSTHDAVALGEIMRRENQPGHMQNHLGGATSMKSGLIRNLALRLTFWIIANAIPFQSRPGFLGQLGTIHFARWVLLPKTNKLLFFSNYGGSWESYLEDFITRAHRGLTAIWSNTIGFPRTRNLVAGGATDGDRFKRWARRGQWPTRFWYSAYPHLTTRRIRLNAAIRMGLAAASTEDEASDWLSCFGSRPRGASTIETREVQSILFGGMGSLRHAVCVLAKLPGKVEDARVWLSQTVPETSFGDDRPNTQALIVAFTVSGLRRLGCEPDLIREFPIAFQEGICEPHRAELLGDTGDDKPESWLWGHGVQAVEVALLLYAESRELLESETARHTEALRDRGGDVVSRIEMEELPKHGQRPREAFGFIDGISQPIIRGTKRWRTTTDLLHVVEPGEVILGYRDNRGHLPITPTVRASADPHNLLPVARSGAPDTDLPNFTRIGGNSRRDLGRNGSFLVIRQLQQQVDQFDQFLTNAADKLKVHPAVPSGLTRKQLQHWLAAKMVGRWRDGTSLVNFPDRPGSGWKHTTAAKGASPDNEFRLGAEDPLGFRCPFGAHIRRANPRDSFEPGSEEQLSITNRHRILRVGRNYRASPQSTTPEETGLLFMCLNADIERQFEFIQQTWAMSSQFLGLDGEVDPLLGRGGENGRLTIPTPDGPILLSGLPDFVTVRGGGYFFLPGRQAMRYLSEMPNRTDT